MKIKFQILIILLSVLNPVWSQNNSQNNLKSVLAHNEDEQKSKTWLDYIYTSNVSMENGIASYNDEAKYIMRDSEYYSIIYPKTYTWYSFKKLVEKKMLKQAVWYMINLYGNDNNNSGNIVDIIISLDMAIDMEKVLISSYYSYISFDPEVVKIESGKVKKYYRPDLAEEKLNNVKEMTAYIYKYREQKAKEGKKG